jgi:hypothetical protein
LIENVLLVGHRGFEKNQVENPRKGGQSHGTLCKPF